MKGENTVKVFGPDLASNEQNADEILEVHGQVPGRRGSRACSGPSGSPTSRSCPTAWPASATGSIPATWTR